MEKDELKYILEELYGFYPELKKYENRLVSLIKEMKINKPDIKFDEEFARELKSKIMATPFQENINNFNFNIMNKKIFIAAGSLIVASLLFVAFINVFGPDKEPDSPWQLASLVNKQEKEEKISYLPAGSFGSLASLSIASSESGQALAPAGLGGSETLNVARETTSGGEVASSDVAIGFGGGGDGKMMIAPAYFGFDYVYVGDDLNLEDESAAVYRRIKNQSTLAKDLARSLSSFNFPGINLKTFDSLVVNNLSFTEDKNQGLMINFDLREGNVYIYEDWEKWQIAEREACGSDQACWDRFRLTVDDVPADSELINLANNFLSTHNIDISNYGEPKVEDQWRVYYAMAENKSDYYIPEQMSVVYPILIEDAPVRDQSGNYTGLRVNINLLHNKVSGLNGLMPYRYEASEYALETDSERIIDLAEDGGWNRNFYMQDAENKQVVELGTPELSYVQTWYYKDNVSSELLVPALIFPVTKKPESGYYGANFIALPLVKEMIDELEKEQQNWLLMRDQIEPMPAVDLPADEPISSDGAADGEVRIMPVGEPMVLEE